MVSDSLSCVFLPTDNLFILPGQENCAKFEAFFQGLFSGVKILGRKSRKLWKKWKRPCERESLFSHKFVDFCFDLFN